MQPGHQDGHVSGRGAQVQPPQAAAGVVIVERGVSFFEALSARFCVLVTVVAFAGMGDVDESPIPAQGQQLRGRGGQGRTRTEYLHHALKQQGQYFCGGDAGAACIAARKGQWGVKVQRYFGVCVARGFGRGRMGCGRQGCGQRLHVEQVQGVVAVQGFKEAGQGGVENVFRYAAG